MRRIRLSRETWFSAAYAITLFVLSLLLHPVLMPNQEGDNYVGMARSLLSGVNFKDVFHPLLYPTCTAGIGWVLGDFFVAAKLVSATAAGLLVWSVYRFARIVFSRACAVVAWLLVALHPSLIVEGMLATDKMLSIALCSLVILVSVKASRSDSWRWVVLAGFSFAMAYWSRYSDQVLILPVVIGLLLPARISNLHRLGRLAVFVLVATVSLVPHFLLTHAQFGSILHDENWRNFALKVFYDRGNTFDMNHMFDMPFHSWGDVISHDPAACFHKAFRSIIKFFFSKEFPAHLTGRDVGEVGWPDWAMAGFVGIGFVATLRAKQPALSIGLSFAIPYLIALVAVFYPWRTHVAVALPMLLVSTTVVVHGLEKLQRWYPRGRVVVAQVVAGAMLVGYIAAKTPGRIASFVAQQPTAEYAAVESLVKQYGSQAKIYVPYVGRGFRNDIEFQLVQGFYPNFPMNRAVYLSRIQRAAVTKAAEFFVVGRVSLFGQGNLDELATGPFPPPLDVLKRTDKVLVLQSKNVEHDPRLPVATVEPNPYRGGPLHVEVSVARQPPDLLGLALRVRGAGNADAWLPLPAANGGRSSITVKELPKLPGQWTLEPYVLTRSGRIMGVPVSWTVE